MPFVFFTFKDLFTRSTSQRNSMADANQEKTFQLVRESWALVAGDLGAVGKLFYETMFEDHADLRSTLFKGVAMEVQAAKLMSMIDGAVKILGKEELVPILLALGVRHSAYGVVDDHYPVVGGVLIKTLKKGLGAKFDAETEAAWVAVYGVIETVMKQGQATPEGQAKYKAWQERQEAAAAKAAE
jgi:hemoglobin-like flavoprotein